MGTRLMGRAALAAAALALLAGCAPADQEIPKSAVSLGDPAEFARELFDKTNAARTAQGELPPLEWSDCLAEAALPRAEASLGTAPLTHLPLPSPCTPGATAGENLSRTWHTAGEVVDLWMGSEAHRANILNPEFTHSGVACVAYTFADPALAADADDPQGGMVCSQLFEGDPS